MSTITWTTESRRLGDLVPHADNPRQIDEAAANRLSDSLDTFSQVDTIAIGPDNQIYNGHQRLDVWMGERGPDFKVDVRVSSRPLTTEERQKLTIYLHEGATGDWNFEVLGNWDLDLQTLTDWGMSPLTLEALTPPEPEPPKPDQPGQLTISPELFERHDYLVFYFDNEFDWQVACESLNITAVISGPVGKGTIVKRGIGRVLPASQLLELLAT